MLSKRGIFNTEIMIRKNIFPRLFVLSLGLLLSISAMAQRGSHTKSTPAERTARLVEQYKKQLDLTSEQTVKLQSIASRTTDATRELRANSSLNREERIEKVKNLREEQEKEVRAMLTPEQQQKYEAWQKKRDSRQAQRKTERGSKRGSR